MCVELFKITEEIKTNLARELKEELKERLKKDEYTEVAVMYDINNEDFYITTTNKIEKDIYNQNVHYLTVCVYKADNVKLTIKNLKEQIFCYNKNIAITIR